LARSIPGADLTLLPRAGHFVVRDDPDSLVEVIRRTAQR
jgi:pimeloyl-ACP methyl ester carboxylesterase